MVAPAAAPTPTLLQPRVAVVLGVPDGWHPLLFACRLLSICPALWFSLLIALRFLVQLPAELAAPGDVGARAFENRLRLTETSLAMVWVGGSGPDSASAIPADSLAALVRRLVVLVLLLYGLPHV